MFVQFWNSLQLYHMLVLYSSFQCEILFRFLYMYPVFNVSIARIWITCIESMQVYFGLRYWDGIKEIFFWVRPWIIIFCILNCPWMAVSAGSNSSKSSANYNQISFSYVEMIFSCKFGPFHDYYNVLFSYPQRFIWDMLERIHDSLYTQNATL